MKKFLSLLAVVFTLGLSTVPIDADAAKRLGGGKSMGTQRQASQDKAPSAPAQSAAAPAAGAAGAAAAPSRSWMGPIAGIAAGLGLAALASHLGFGGELASMLMFGLLAFAIMAAVGFFLRKRAATQRGDAMGRSAPAYAHAHPGAGGAQQLSLPASAAPAYKVALPEGGRAASGLGIGSAVGSGIGSAVASNSGVGVATARQIPADFDTAAFERQAKVNFIRLQAANDAGNLDDIRQFTTPEMFAELSMELADRGTQAQSSEVVSLAAAVQDVLEDADRYVVSVRFTGFIKDKAESLDESFDEVWLLMKARHANGGWVLSGIQQTA